jgi:hypothetical protein
LGDEADLDFQESVAVGADGVDTVDGDLVAVELAALDGEAGTDAGGIEGVSVAADDAGFDEGEVDGVAGRSRAARRGSSRVISA